MFFPTEPYRITNRFYVMCLVHHVSTSIVVDLKQLKSIWYDHLCKSSHVCHNIVMAGILSSIGGYISGILSPAFAPSRVEVPVDESDPRYSKSFTVDQVDEHKKVR